MCDNIAVAVQAVFIGCHMICVSLTRFITAKDIYIQSEYNLMQY